MDLVFHEYASPFLLLDNIIGQGMFVDFLVTFQEQREERQLWEMYINKIPVWDDRSFEEFKRDVTKGRRQKQDIPKQNEIEATIQNSYDILNNFKL